MYLLIYKNIQVNPDKRHKRKEELFPEFWAKTEKPENDEIIPEDVSHFEFEQSEFTTTESFEDLDHNKPLLFDDELEPRRREPSNHPFCCSSG